MKKSLFLLALIAGISFAPMAQVVLLEDTVTEKVVEKKFGPNQQHYVNTFFNFGLNPFAHSGELNKQNSPWSFDFQMGVRYKYKISNYYALGAQVYYNLSTYSIDYVDPDLEIGSSEDFEIGAWGLELYQRFNFAKRGNTLGLYFDLGAYGEWNAYRDHIVTIDGTDMDLYKEEVRRYRKVEYIHPFSYGLSARLGYNNVSLYARYRLSDLVDAEKITPAELGFEEFTPLSLGISFHF